jgi:Mg2+ and Co2+ transporter CorA
MSEMQVFLNKCIHRYLVWMVTNNIFWCVYAFHTTLGIERQTILTFALYTWKKKVKYFKDGLLVCFHKFNFNDFYQEQTNVFVELKTIKNHKGSVSVLRCSRQIKLSQDSQ